MHLSWNGMRCLSSNKHKYILFHFFSFLPQIFSIVRPHFRRTSIYDERELMSLKIRSQTSLSLICSNTNFESFFPRTFFGFSFISLQIESLSPFKTTTHLNKYPRKNVQNKKFLRNSQWDAGEYSYYKIHCAIKSTRSNCDDKNQNKWTEIKLTSKEISETKQKKHKKAIWYRCKQNEINWIYFQRTTTEINTS